MSQHSEREVFGEECPYCKQWYPNPLELNHTKEQCQTMPNDLKSLPSADWNAAPTTSMADILYLRDLIDENSQNSIKV